MIPLQKSYFLMGKVFCSYRPADHLFLRALIRILIHRWMKTDISTKYQRFFRGYKLFIQLVQNSISSKYFIELDTSNGNYNLLLVINLQMLNII